jgi:hypothetical protein
VPSSLTVRHSPLTLTPVQQKASLDSINDGPRLAAHPAADDNTWT